MAPKELVLVCRVRITETDVDHARPVRVEDIEKATPALRMAWFSAILHQAQPDLQREDIQPFDLALHPDGTVENIAEDSRDYALPRVYPTDYWMPPELVEGRFDAVFQKEKFATAILAGFMLFPNKSIGETPTDSDFRRLLVGEDSPLYLDNLTDEERAQFDHAKEQTGEDTNEQEVITSSTGNIQDQEQGFTPMEWASWAAHGVASHATNNPGQFALQVAGGVVATGALATPLVLGAAGFAATGPVAGTAAAAWQASIGGAVAAGSPFAICQSIAMGGAAAGSVIAGGVTGGAAAIAGSVPALARIIRGRW
ncbi:MAG: hypothetical protein M1823_005789 [Watsoniomyces obsoletus]|nr:MAG: hypothetical protein M1823_005789 [Watsoniomyces obsoletus]